MAYGRTSLANNNVFPTRVSADGIPKYKAGGITIDWATVAALGSDTTLPDGSVVRSGQKMLRYGQVVTKITATGLFGPYDPAAADGRQTLARGDCFVMDETVLQYPSGSPLLGASTDQTGGAIEGGDIWIDRVLQAGTGAASLAAGPTLANLSTAFPAFYYVRN